MWIVNTRPKERAGQLNTALTLLGYQVYDFPLLALQALALEENLRQQFQTFLDADIVVVVSPIAVQLGMQYYQTLGYTFSKLLQKQWIAVGKTTQERLLDYGVASDRPCVENSEGMLQLPTLQDVKDKKIAFWRGVGGRELIINKLQSQGGSILNMLLYTRQSPHYDIQDLTALSSHLPAIILISSEESWKNWLSLNQQFATLQQQLAKQVYVVLGDRVSQIIEQYFAVQGLAVDVLNIQYLNAQAIHQRLQQYWNHE